MKYCTICGKPLEWQGTITFTTSTGSFALVPDMCPGHPTAPITKTGTIRLYAPLQPMPLQRCEPVPQAFQDAFDEPLHP